MRRMHRLLEDLASRVIYVGLALHSVEKKRLDLTELASVQNEHGNQHPWYDTADVRVLSSSIPRTESADEKTGVDH